MFNLSHMASPEPKINSRAVTEGEPLKADPITLRNIKRLLEEDSLVGQLELNRELNPAESRKLANLLAERNWYKILNLKPGDQVAYFLAPSGDFSIKNLNDKYFGPQLTDQIIAERNKILAGLLEQKHLASLLQEDFRSSIYQITSEQKDIEETLNGICLELSFKMRDFLLANDGVFASAEKEVRKSGLATLSGQERLRNLQDLKNKVQKFGFRLSFGLSQVKANEAKPLIAPVLAVTEASQAAQLSRHGQDDKKYGTKYNQETVLTEIQAIAILREEISQQYSQFMDAKGIKYQVFTQVNDKYVLNRDLIRAVRKEELQPGQGQELAFNKIKEYVRRLNLLDIVKPYTVNEIEADGKLPAGKHTVAEKQKEIKDLIATLNSGQLSEAQSKEVAGMLNTEARDGNCDSAAQFHKKAMAIDDCVYITIDVLDVGVDLLLEYEQLMQAISAGDKTLTEASLEAGDKMTLFLRDNIRAKALQITAKHLEKNRVQDGQICSLAGGDELTLALNNHVGVDKLLLELQKATRGRIIKTVVAKAERQNAPSASQSNRLVEHVSALKRSEQGTEIAKKVEAQKRVLELKMTQSLAAEQLSAAQIRQKIEETFLSLDLDNYYVQENGNGQFVVITSQGRELRVKDVEAKIDQILKE